MARCLGFSTDVSLSYLRYYVGHPLPHALIQLGRGILERDPHILLATRAFPKFLFNDTVVQADIAGQRGVFVGSLGVGGAGLLDCHLHVFRLSLVLLWICHFHRSSLIAPSTCHALIHISTGHTLDAHLTGHSLIAHSPRHSMRRHYLIGIGILTQCTILHSQLHLVGILVRYLAS